MGLFGSGGREREDEAQWMPVSDLMAGVMLVFLFIAVAFMLSVDPRAKTPDAAEAGAAERLPQCLQDLERCGSKLEGLAEHLPLCEQKLERCSAEQKEGELAVQVLPRCRQDLERCEADLKGLAHLRGTSAEIGDVLQKWQDREADIRTDLKDTFSQDLQKWGAEIKERTMLIRFHSPPEALFAKGSSELTPDFQVILDDFFPRYISVLKRFKEYIEEIRIEGHTSSEWGPDTRPEEAYIRNMDLSQQRTRSVLSHGLDLLDDEDRQWVQPLLTANGLSSSRTIMADGAEDPELSRRVEFRVHTRLRDELDRIDTLLNAPPAETAPARPTR